MLVSAGVPLSLVLKVEILWPRFCLYAHRSSAIHFPSGYVQVRGHFQRRCPTMQRRSDNSVLLGAPSLYRAGEFRLFETRNYCQAGKLRCAKNQYFISLLQVYHYWQSKRNLYIVMEFVSHGELFSLWQRLPVFPEVSPYFCAVGYCYVTDHCRPDIDLVTIIHQCFGLSYSLPSFSPSVRIWYEFTWRN